jgi:putative flippase GtrA
MALTTIMNLEVLWWRVPQNLRFLVAGAYNTAFGYAAFVILYLLLNPRVNYLIVGLLAYAVSVISAFAVHRCLVFRAKDGLAASFLRFNLSQAVVLGFGMAGLYLFVQIGHMNPLLAQALVLGLSVTIMFALHSKFSFRNHIT